MSHCNKCSQRFDACSDCDIGEDVQALRQRITELERKLAEQPALLAKAREEEREKCAALAMSMFHAAAQGDEIADAIRARGEE